MRYEDAHSDGQPLVDQVRASRLPPPSVRRRIRFRADVSLREAARSVGVTPMTYLRWERGEVQPKRANAIRLRQFLDALDEAADG